MAKHMASTGITPTHEQISRRAYEIFIERGSPEGRDMEHWLEAEAQLSAATLSNGSPQAREGQTSARQQTSARGTSRARK